MQHITRIRRHSSLFCIHPQFCSCAHYVTNGIGGVDVQRAVSVGGSYEGVFPAGLLTTLVPAPDELQSLRLYRRDTSLPWRVSGTFLLPRPPTCKTTLLGRPCQFQEHFRQGDVVPSPMTGFFFQCSSSHPWCNQPNIGFRSK